MSSDTAPNANDPIEYFLEEQDFLGNEKGTKDGYEHILHDFEEYLNDPSRNHRGEVIDLEDADRRDCLGWIQEYRDDEFGYADSTIASYAAQLHSFFRYMTEIGELSSNPMVNVLQKIDESVDSNPQRREASVSDMAGFVDTVHHPLTRAIIMTLVKSGMRRGEMINLDTRDVHIDSPAVNNEYPEVRPEIEDHPDSIFISSEISVGDVVNGEKRNCSNKRKRDTIVPVDDELKVVLSRWLAARPDSSSDADPLFTAIYHNWGERLSKSTVKEYIRNETVPYGWYDHDSDLTTNVTPHYFRHFFTTHMRALSGDDVMVKYIRGDVGDDIMDNYTHHWGSKVRQQYEASIFKLL